MPPFWEVPPPHTPARCREDVEADTRVLMAKHASIAPRGFDSNRERAAYHARIDQLLDEHSIFAALKSLDGTEAAAIRLVTGLTDADISELGGLP